MGDIQGEIDMGGGPYQLPEQKPRTDVPNIKVPIPISKEFDDLFTPGSIGRLHFNAHQLIAAARYIKRVARRYWEDPAFRNDFQELKLIYHELANKHDEESELIKSEIQSLWPKVHFS